MNSTANVNLHAFFEGVARRGIGMQESNPHPSACLCHPQERNCGPSEPPPRGRYRCLATCLLIGGPGRDRRDRRPGRWALRPFRRQQRRSNRQQQGSNSISRGSSPGSRGGSDWSDNNINSGREATNSDNDGRPSSRVGSGRESGTSDERPSSDYSPASPQFKKPKVTFGDGRTPGVQDHDTGPRWDGQAPETGPTATPARGDHRSAESAAIRPRPVNNPGSSSGWSSLRRRASRIRYGASPGCC